MKPSLHPGRFPSGAMLAAGGYAAAGALWISLSRVSWEWSDVLFVAAGGGLVYFLMRAAETSARRREEEARRGEAGRQELLASVSPDGIHILDAAGRLLRANPAFYHALGYDAAEAPALSVGDWEARHAPEEVVAKLARLRGRSETIETLHRDRHGVARPVEVSISGVELPEGPRFFCIARDLTERRRLEAGRARADRIAGLVLLSGGIAHEMNNALASIALGAELLRQDNPRLAGDLRLQSILNSARAGAAAVHRVLTFAQGIEGERSEVDLAELMEEILRDAEARRGIGLRVRRQIAAGLPAVTGDPVQLRQVLRGIVANALEAMARETKDGCLTVTLAGRRLDAATAERLGLLAGEHVECRIADNGPGLGAEARRQLFSPYFTTKPVGEGAGLGLAMALGVVRSHGGTIEHADAPGGGAEFHVILPVARSRE